MYNCFIGALVIDNMVLSFALNYLVMFIAVGSIIQTTFIWEDMEYHTAATLALSIIYVILLVPLFVWITQNIRDEHTKESKIAYTEKVVYKKMFDGLQEGVVVLQGEELSFMNDLSNRVLSELTGLKNFLKNKDLHGNKDKQDPLDRKVFYLFE